MNLYSFTRIGNYLLRLHANIAQSASRFISASPTIRTFLYYYTDHSSLPVNFPSKNKKIFCHFLRPKTSIVFKLLSHRKLRRQRPLRPAVYLLCFWSRKDCRIDAAAIASSRFFFFFRVSSVPASLPSASKLLRRSS